MPTTDSPRVLFLANAFPPVIGGSANVYASLCKQLGPDAFAIAPRRTYYDGKDIPGWRQWDAEQPFHIHRLNLLRPEEKPRPRTLLHSAWRWLTEDLAIERQVCSTARSVLRRERIDVLCIGEIYSLSGIAQKLRHRTGIPFVLYVHGEELTCLPGTRRYQKNARRALCSADALIAVSSFTRNQLISRYGVDPARVHVIPNGVDISRFSPGARRTDLLRRHDLAGKRILLTVGRLITRKGHDMTIRALPAIAEAVPNVTYLIVGSGPENKRLEELASQTGVAHLIRFVTDVSAEDLVHYYRICDLFIMPNRTLPDGDTEGFGLVFLEAGACGKPVIGGNAGGVPDAVQHGHNGLLVDGSSEAEIASTAIRLLQDGDLAAQIGHNGRQVATRASWESKAIAFQNVCAAIRPTRAGEAIQCAT